MQVLVRDNNVDQALKALKKKMQREGIFREMKLRRHYEKPSERRAREAAEAVRRARKLERKRLEREGFWALSLRRERKLPLFPDQVMAETVVRLRFNEAEADALIDAAGCHQNIVGP